MNNYQIKIRDYIQKKTYQIYNYKKNIIPITLLKIRKLLLCFSIIYMFFPTYSPFLSQTCGKFFNRWPNDDNLRSLLISIFFIWSICFLIKNRTNNKSPTQDSILLIVFIYLIYFFLFRECSLFRYIKIFGFNIYITDVLWFTLWSLLANYQYKGEQLVKGTFGIIEDNPNNIGEQDDSLKRQGLVKEIVKAINNTSSEKAVSIAVLSAWGNGKTVFLNFLKKSLEKNDKNIVVEFNPWKAEKEQISVQAFFSELELSLNPYDSGVSKQINSYAKKLLEVSSDENIISKAIKLLFDKFLKPEVGTSVDYSSINDSIKRIGKRIIIFIDDLDRLTGDELTLIMRLIRNTADFNNMIFIAAFDKNYINNNLNKSIESNLENNYLEKIFQLEVVLPPIRPQVIKDIFLTYFKNELPEDELNTERINFYNVLSTIAFVDDEFTYLGLPSRKDFLEMYLKNIRDVIRFTNSFKITYRIVREEVDLKEIILLELIKYKFPSIYIMLSNVELQLSGKTNMSVQELDENKLKVLYDNNNNELHSYSLYKDSHGLLEKTLKVIFDNKLLNDRSVAYSKNHHLYFNYDLFDSISLKEFNKIKTGDYESLKVFIENLFNESPNKLDNYVQILEKIKAFSSEDEFFNLFKSLLLSGGLLKKWESIRPSITNFINHYQQSGYEINTFNTFLSDKVLQNKDFDILMRSELLLILLHNYLYNRPNNILSKGKLIEINFQNFKWLIENHPKEEKTISEVLYKNYVAIKDGRVIINPEAMKLYRTYLNKYNDYYFEYIIRPYYYPEGEFNEYTFDPFLFQIFDDNKDFEQFIDKNTTGTRKEYIKGKFKEFGENNYAPIVIEDFKKNISLPKY